MLKKRVWTSLFVALNLAFRSRSKVKVKLEVMVKVQGHVSGM